MKTLVLVSIMMSIFFIGCTTPSLEEQKTQCKEAGKKYDIVEQFNYRTGNMDKFVKCK